jgi:hypothetical protein
MKVLTYGDDDDNASSCPAERPRAAESTRSWLWCSTRTTATPFARYDEAAA